MRLSLRQRTFAITAAALLPILFALIYNEIRLRDYREQEVRELALSTARQAALEMDRLTTGAEGVLRAIAAAPVVTNLNNELCTPYLAQLKDALPQFRVITVLDRDGFVRCRSGRPTDSASFADRSYFREALAPDAKLFIGEFTISRIDGRRGLPLSVPVLSDGRTVGVLVSALDLDWLGESLRARKLANRASLTIADSTGTIIAREPLSEQFVGTKIPAAFASLLTEKAAGTINVKSQDGTERILGYVPLGEAPKGLYVSAGVSRDEAFAAVNEATTRNIVFGLCGAALAVLLAWLLGDRLLQGPVRRIAATLAARRAGDDLVRTGLSARQGDLEALGEEIDAYIDELNRGKAEKELAEQHRALLTEELSHRVKNLLATVQAVAAQTFRADGDRRNALEVFNGRIAAMAKAQHLLLLGRSEAASVADAIAGAIAVFEAAPAGRFTLSGPDVAVGPEAALSLAMAAHELSTNAVKYGALSAPDGRIDIVWEVRGGLFRLTWTERGGPPVRPPGRKGFGTRMIERVLATELGGKAAAHFDPAGFSYVFEAPEAALRRRPQDESAAA